jgi:hypothetical protein
MVRNVDGGDAILRLLQCLQQSQKDQNWIETQFYTEEMLLSKTPFHWFTIKLFFGFVNVSEDNIL